jgi:benzoate-CoA ligase
MWVSPIEIENTLLEHPSVLESGVVGDTDADGLLKPKAFILLKSEYKPSDELRVELQNHMKSKLAPYKYPRWVEFVDELPKTVTGKIQRFRLRSKKTEDRNRRWTIFYPPSSIFNYLVRRIYGC